MNIFVFASLLPNHAEFDPDKLQKVKLSAFDSGVLETAILLKHQFEGSVTLAVFGPKYVEPAIRKLISGDIDSAVHLLVDDETFETADAFSIATAFGNFLNDKEFDLVLFGKNDANLINGLPQITAEMINLPCVTNCRNIKIEDDDVTLNRKSDVGVEKILTSLPCVVEFDHERTDLPKSSLLKLLKAQFKRVETEDAATAHPKVELVKLEDHPARKQKFFTRDEIPHLVSILKDEEKVI
ncbi:hypothetical protein HN587_02275 [Candidatus Woesearchaeota archaeon]|jgi:electron transfer flavoprotein beta subunit|nr:hypothetical protein [Candidatus Woesearchaeota archaeon]